MRSFALIFAIVTTICVHCFSQASESADDLSTLTKQLLHIATTDDSLDKLEQQHLLTLAKWAKNRSGQDVSAIDALLMENFCSGDMCNKEKADANYGKYVENDDVGLPDGWVSYKDHELNKFYYYCQSTGQTLWERPTDSQAVDTPRNTLPMDKQHFVGSSKYVAQPDMDRDTFKTLVSRTFGDACDPTSVRIKVSKRERKTQSLRKATFGAIVDALRECGVAVVVDALEPAFVDRLASEENELFTAFMSRVRNNETDELPSPDTFRQEFPDLKDFSQLTGTDRVEMKMPFEGAWKSPLLWKNVAFSPISAAMGAAEDEVEVDQFITISSLPRAPPNWWHRDAPPIFSNFPRKVQAPTLPPYAFVVVAPLVDMTEELGPTQFLLRSHVPCMSADMVNVSLPLSESDYGRVKDPLMECSDAQHVLTAESTRGSMVIFDIRVLHRGTRNLSHNTRRPIAYWSYVYKWFRDSVNYNHMYEEKLSQTFSEELHTLMSRIHGERAVLEQLRQFNKGLADDVEQQP